MKAVIVGAGTMGQGIAEVGLSAGWEIHLVDVDQEILQAARSAIMRRLARRPADREPASQPSIDTLCLGTDLRTACLRADVVIETASEDLAVKVGILTAAAEATTSDAILATNTSALSVTEMGAASGAPHRLVGLHFFNPVPRMRLVEVIRGLETSEAVVERAANFCLELGKDPVILNDSPAFVASRVNALIGNEAFTMLQEGVASAEDIDKALRLGLNHPMGPFELGDLVGWDVRYKVLQHLHVTLGDRFRPNPLMVKYVQAGRLGRKTGRGVYEYPAIDSKG
ncbi:3-hydroxyacyl-CoA dehydrogenase NAD-binding domain-containing protein [Jatrophihabitans telluris]|uniref:3-hydroxyacyl-CoA dehydrogenase NAD-binding domain-containing protein n=1 Tax=Jatrophihabitans telluris TaxID=2038343 RepID=A0ABY4R0E5_9ACTN|nr:3-hydroxyacyl-CoA dehydrogenase NAD-binding domain-containing protein [Jatrophihabitans telluris]UQX88982.1 3-hydroxyacyl-CoA dehydrogenase NAD-binding domain-containing protein [Jatrophihabitans telluris]